MLPYRLEKSLRTDTMLYSYKDVVELVAWALIPDKSRENYSIDSFKENYPDVFDQKMVEADRLISSS